MKRHASMNRIYRLVWSQVRNAWIAVSEISKGHGKSGRSKSALKRKALATAIALVFSPLAHANPAGGQLVSGAGSISQSGSTITINQTSQNLSLNWQSFNVAPTETVNFQQPSASAIAVNRIFDTNGSLILGHLNANGQVWLINPNGILFGQGAQVNVGGLVASTLNLNDATLNSNTRTFETPPPQEGEGQGITSDLAAGIMQPSRMASRSISGSVINQGTINAANGGYVALLGNHVSNQGSITANLGTVALGAGSAATLTFNGNNLIHLQVEQSTLNNLAENGGLIQADGGQVLMTAGAKNAVLASVVNNTGVIEARTVDNHNGIITLLAGMVAGTVNVGGTLDASAPNSANGGQIETSAAHVKIASDAKVTTAAANGLSGTWLIDPVDFTIAATGGDITGATLSSNLGSGNVVIQSTAGTTGTAGDVNVNDVVSWSANKLTLNAQNNINVNSNLNGSGTASLALEYGQGAALAGNTSNYFLNNGAQVNLPAGQNFSTKLGSNGVTKNYTVITSLGAAADATTAPTIMTLQGMAATTSLTGNYVLGADIDATATAAWNSNGAATPVYEGFTPIGNAGTKFSGTFDGLGHAISNLAINRPTTTDVGLFGDTNVSSIIQNVGLAGADVSGTAMVGGLVGYAMGGVRNSYVTVSMTGQGTVTGTGNYVGGLVGYSSGSIDNSYSSSTVNGASNTGGLVGGSVGTSSVAATITGSFATGDVEGTTYVGGLAGFVNYNTTSQSYATGDVSGGGNVGGLVGYAKGAVISGSYATGAVGPVTGVNGSFIGGLVGYSTCVLGSTTPGKIKDSFATGNVSGGADVGGLVGYNLGGEVLNSHASGRVTATVLYVGGLVGNSESTSALSLISDSYATGNVEGPSYVGGLVGRDYHLATVTRSYATGNVTGLSTGAGSVGGLVGLAQGVDISDSYASGSVTGTKSYTGGLVGKFTNLNATASTINNSYASGAVTGIIGSTGGLVGINFVSPGWRTASTVNSSFWDTTTSGQTTSAGGVGMTTAQMQLQANFTSATPANNNVNPAWDFANTWVMYDGHTYPLLRSFMRPLTVSANTAIKTYDGQSYSNANGVSYSEIPDSNLLGTVNFTTDNPLGDINVGSYTITPAGLYSNQQGYIISYASGNLTVNQAPLSASVTGTPSKVYDGNAYATLTPNNYSLSGFVSGEGATVGQTVGTYNSPNVLAADSVSASLSPTDFTANSATLLSNYILPNTATGAGNITPKPLTASVSAPDKVYNGNTSAAPTLSITSGLVNGESVTATGTATFNSKDVLTANTVTVNSIHLANGVNGLVSNYSLATGETTTAHITAASLTAIATATDKVYNGNTTAAPTLTIASGLVSGETVTATGTGTFNSKDVLTADTVTVNGTQLADGANGLASNYSIATGETTTAHIIAAPLTATVTAPDKVYNGNTSAAPTLSITSGLVSGESVTATGTATFNSKDVLAANTVTVNSTQLADGANGLASNYSLATGETTTAHITAAPLTAMASAPDKVYNGNTTAAPILTIVSGLVSGETVTATGTGTFNSKDVQTANTVTVNSTMLIDGASGLASNYSLAIGQTATAHISSAELVVTVNSTSKTYGQANPTLSGNVTGFVGSDTLANATSGTEVFTIPATGNSNAGNYAITGSGLSANNGNYIFTQAAENATALTVNPAVLTITALNSGMSSGNVNPVLRVNYQGFVNGDSASSLVTAPSVTTTATASSGAGNYPITVSGASAPNYTITYVNGKLTVYPGFHSAIAGNALENAVPVSRPQEASLHQLTAPVNSLFAELTDHSTMTSNPRNHKVLPNFQLGDDKGKGLLTVVSSGVKLPEGM